jgi:hypothetical protein
MLFKLSLNGKRQESLTMKKIAAIQMCSSNLVEENLETAAKLIKKASDNDVTLVVLPEMFPIFGLRPVDKICVYHENRPSTLETVSEEPCAR